MTSPCPTNPPVNLEDSSSSPSSGILECPICLQAVESDGEHVPAALTCGHCFGLSCLTVYFGGTRSKKCPLCQTLVKSAQIRKLFLPAFGAKTAEVESLKRKLEEQELEIQSLQKRVRFFQLVTVERRVFEIRNTPNLGKFIIRLTGNNDGVRLVYNMDGGIYVALLDKGEALQMGNGQLIGISQKREGEIKALVDAEGVFSRSTDEQFVFMAYQPSDSKLALQLPRFKGFCDGCLISDQGDIWTLGPTGCVAPVTRPFPEPVTALIRVSRDTLLVFSFKQCWVLSLGTDERSDNTTGALWRSLQYEIGCLAGTEIEHMDRGFVTSHRLGAGRLLVGRWNSQKRQIDVLAKLSGHNLTFNVCRPSAIVVHEDILLVSLVDKAQGRVILWKGAIDSGIGNKRAEFNATSCPIPGRTDDNHPLACELLQSCDGTQIYLATVSPTMLTVDLISI